MKKKNDFKKDKMLQLREALPNATEIYMKHHALSVDNTQ